MLDCPAMTEPSPIATTTSASQASTGLAVLLKAAGDPLRLSALRLLQQSSYGVLELCQLLTMRQSLLSHHLKVLAQAGLVAQRREGNAIFYRRALPEGEARAVVQALYQTLDAEPLPAELGARVAALNEQRASASREFFDRHGARVPAQQELIATVAQYRELLAGVLDGLPPTLDAIEVGPGDGSFLADLAPRCRTLTALDVAPAMLAQTEAAIAAADLRNVRACLGDILAATVPLPPAGLVVMNMVLHHLPDPAVALARLARLVSPGGALVLSELCPHEQDWAREACGDVWLGFAPEALIALATSAGFRVEASQYLGLRNGFQIQVHRFTRALAPTPQGASAI